MKRFLPGTYIEIGTYRRSRKPFREIFFQWLSVSLLWLILFALLMDMQQKCNL